MTKSEKLKHVAHIILFFNQIFYEILIILK